jgi:hypothetical protein
VPQAGDILSRQDFNAVPFDRMPFDSGKAFMAAVVVIVPGG